MVIKMTEFINELKKLNLGKMIFNASLKEYTTYKVGGMARVIIYPKNIDALILLLNKLKSNSIKYMVLGNGSNTLFSDDVYEGVIIKLDEFNQIEFHNNKVVVGAGVSLMKVAYQSIRRGLTGLEFATGIPGSIGGAVYMNAGAYKSDMGYVVSKIKVLTPKMKVITMVNKELDFHYRTSFLKQNKGYICLEATIQLKKGDKEAIQQVVEDRKKRRLESQPLEYPSAGSVFRNPSDMFAGKLIEDLGYKGLVKGGAMVSEKHANFIVNFNHAKARDVKELIDFMKQVVKENYDVDLVVEQEFINWE